MFRHFLKGFKTVLNVDRGLCLLNFPMAKWNSTSSLIPLQTTDLHKMLSLGDIGPCGMTTRGIQREWQIGRNYQFSLYSALYRGLLLHEMGLWTFSYMHLGPVQMLLPCEQSFGPEGGMVHLVDKDGKCVFLSTSCRGAAKSILFNLTLSFWVEEKKTLSMLCKNIW